MRFLATLFAFLFTGGVATAATFFPPSTSGEYPFAARAAEVPFKPFKAEDSTTYSATAQICPVLCTGTPTCPAAELADPANRLTCFPVDETGRVFGMVTVPNRGALSFVYGVAIGKTGLVSGASADNQAIINVPPQPPIVEDPMDVSATLTSDQILGLPLNG